MWVKTEDNGFAINLNMAHNIKVFERLESKIVEVENPFIGKPDWVKQKVSEVVGYDVKATVLLRGEDDKSAHYNWFTVKSFDEKDDAENYIDDLVEKLNAEKNA